jgi:hypothetical protein
MIDGVFWWDVGRRVKRIDDEREAEVLLRWQERRRWVGKRMQPGRWFVRVRYDDGSEELVLLALLKPGAGS